MRMIDSNRTGLRGDLRRAAGFTILELMIAVASLAIIMGIAIPSYNKWVIESGRADGKAELFATAQALERCYTRFSSYADGNCSIANGASIPSEKGKYTISVRSAANTFTLTATPQGGQAEDDECGALTRDHTGAKGVGGDATGTVADCW